MLATPQDMRAQLQELTSSAWTLASICVLYESGSAARLREPRSAEELAAHCPGLSRSQLERCLAVAAGAGVLVKEGTRYRLAEGALAFAHEPMRAPLQGELRSTLMQALAFVDSAGAASAGNGWRHTDRAVLQAQGDQSAGLPPMWKTNLVPQLGDLAARLEQPGARFLDVGVGVGALSIAMCRVWPAVQVVGLDTFDVPLSIARENIARAGFTERIELRKLAVEQLADEAAFDLAWLPTFFIPGSVLTQATARMHACLRPGGFLFFPVLGSAGQNPQQRAVLALLNDLWGGPVLGTLEAETLLEQAGFASVRTLPAPSGAPGMVVAQR